MTAPTSIWLAVIAYVAVLAGIGWSSRRTSDGFVLGNRNVGWLGTTASQIVSIFDGTGFLICITLGITLGFGFLWSAVGACLPYLLLATQAARVRHLAQTNRYVTVSDLLRDRLGPRTAYASAVVTVVGMFLSMGASVHISGSLFSRLLGVPDLVGIGLVCAVTAAYLITGGYASVVRTDILQWGIVVGFALFGYWMGEWPTAIEAAHQFANTPPEYSWGLFLLLLFTNYAYLDTWQRIFSARSASTAIRGTALTTPISLAIFVSFVVFGTAIATHYPHLPANDFVFQSLHDPALPSGIGVIVCLALVALIMSTLDSRAYTVAATLSANILAIDPGLQRTRFIATTRWIIGAMFVVLATVAIFITDVVAYIIDVGSVFTVFAPMLFLATIGPRPLHRRRYDRHMRFALLAGTTTWAFMFLAGLYHSYFHNLIPIAVSALLSLAGIAFDRPWLTSKFPFGRPVRLGH